jgi:hypothetical protein
MLMIDKQNQKIQRQYTEQSWISFEKKLKGLLHKIRIFKLQNLSKGNKNKDLINYWIYF